MATLVPLDRPGTLVRLVTRVLSARSDCLETKAFKEQTADQVLKASLEQQDALEIKDSLEIWVSAAQLALLVQTVNTFSPRIYTVFHKKKQPDT